MGSTGSARPVAGALAGCRAPTPPALTPPALPAPPAPPAPLAAVAVESWRWISFERRLRKARDSADSSRGGATLVARNRDAMATIESLMCCLEAILRRRRGTILQGQARGPNSIFRYSYCPIILFRYSYRMAALTLAETAIEASPAGPVQSAFHPTKLVIIFSGKRKSGKDYVTDRFLEKIVAIAGPGSCEIGRLSAPLKEAYARENGLDFAELLSDGPYKEKYRADMIKWGEDKRRDDPAYFARLVFAQVRSFPFFTPQSALTHLRFVLKA